MIAADIDPMSVAAIALNAEANGTPVTVTGTDLLTAPAAAAAQLAGAGVAAPDLVVVGDACYERRMAHRMLAFLRQAQSSGAATLLGDPGRAYLPPQACGPGQLRRPGLARPGGHRGQAEHRLGARLARLRRDLGRRAAPRRAKASLAFELPSVSGVKVER